LVETQRTVTITLPDDPDLRATLDAFQRVQQRVSPVAFNDGQPLKAVPLQRTCYHEVKGTLNSQMTITALRLVAGAYASARANKRPAQKPFNFHRKSAMFLVGQRGRDAAFRKDGSLSIWTVAGRQRFSYRIPQALQRLFEQANEIDSLTVIERKGKLLGRVVLTLEYPDPRGIHPIGIDLNETNALVAVDVEGNNLFISGKDVKVRNKRNFKTRKRLQNKLASRKAAGKDTHSVRRTLKRLGRRRSNRTRTFAQTAAKLLCQWASSDSVLVFEALKMPQPRRGKIRGTALRRRLSQWQHGLIRHYAESKAQEFSLAVAEVNPAYTSQICSRCGLLGKRRRHDFSCPSCGFSLQADLNAAINIRNRFTVSRDGGLSSTSPEALADYSAEGKPPALAGGC
jgi:IS605 OrfB family transposase